MSVFVLMTSALMTCLLAFNSSMPAAPAKNKDYKETQRTVRCTVAI